MSINEIISPSGQGTCVFKGTGTGDYHCSLTSLRGLSHNIADQHQAETGAASTLTTKISVLSAYTCFSGLLSRAACPQASKDGAALSLEKATRCRGELFQMPWEFWHSFSRKLLAALPVQQLCLSPLLIRGLIFKRNLVSFVINYFTGLNNWKKIIITVKSHLDWKLLILELLCRTFSPVNCWETHRGEGLHCSVSHQSHQTNTISNVTRDKDKNGCKTLKLQYFSYFGDRKRTTKSMKTVNSSLFHRWVSDIRISV